MRRWVQGKQTVEHQGIWQQRKHHRKICEWRKQI